MIKFLSKHKALFVILSATVCIYAGTLFHDYTLDDTLVITHNEFTKKGIQGIPEILSNDGFVGFFGHHEQLITGGRYRPMAQVFFAIEYQLFGLNPMVGHLLNIVFYVLTCWLVFVILSRLCSKPPTSVKYYFTLPFIATMLFAVHPLHTEVVANIKGRDEIFSLLGALGALFLALKYAEKPKFSTLTGLFLAFTFGLFSKENALTFWLIIPLTVYLFSQKHDSGSGVDIRKKPARKTQFNKPIIITLSIASILFLAARYHALGFWIGDFKNLEILNDPFLYASPIQRLATVLYTWLIYFKLLFIPYPLTHDYYPFQIPILDFSNIYVWFSVILICFFICYMITHFKKNRMVSYGILYFGITFSMASNLVLNVGTFMNERFMYAPLLGFAIVVGYFGQTFAQRGMANKRLGLSSTRILAVIVLVVFHVLGISTIKRNRVWKDDLTLFTTDVKTSVNSAKANVSAGGKLTEYAETLSDDSLKETALNQAYQYLHKGIELHPNNPQAWFLFGNCCRALKHYDKAYTAYNNALLINPTMNDAQNNILYTAQQAKLRQNYDVAKKFYALAVKYYPESAHKCELAECYIRIGHPDSASLILDQVLRSEPNHVAALNKKAEISGLHKHDLTAALKMLQTAYKADSTALTTNENLGIVYGMMHHCERSIFHFKKALAKDTANLRIKENLQRSYAICGQKP